MGVKVREKPKGSGIYWIFINHNGTRKAKRIGDEKAALKAAKLLDARLAVGDLSPIANHKNFEDYAETFLEEIIPSHSKPKTIRAYRSTINAHLLPEFNGRRIDRITKLDIKRFLIAKSKTHADNHTRVMKAVLSGIFNLAIEDGAIQNNPALQLGKLYRAKKKAAAPNPLTEQEVEKLLAAFQRHYTHQDYTTALLFVRAGLRAGEVFALKWEDIDFMGREIHICRTRDETNEVTLPKRDKERTVDMSLELTEALKQHQRHMAEVKLRKGWGEQPEYVFVNENTGVWTTPARWRSLIFHKALEKARVRRVRLHDLRHTYASLLLMAGINVLYVQRQLGHSDPRITLEVYSHYLPKEDTEVKEVDILDATKRNLSATNGCKTA